MIYLDDPDSILAHCDDLGFSCVSTPDLYRNGKCKRRAYHSSQHGPVVYSHSSDQASTSVESHSDDDQGQEVEHSGNGQNHCRIALSHEGRIERRHIYRLAGRARMGSRRHLEYNRTSEQWAIESSRWAHDRLVLEECRSSPTYVHIPMSPQNQTFQTNQAAHRTDTMAPALWKHLASVDCCRRSICCLLSPRNSQLMVIRVANIPCLFRPLLG